MGGGGDLVTEPAAGGEPGGGVALSQIAGVAPPLPADLREKAGIPRWLRHVGLPVFISLSCLALYLWVRSQELDSIELRLLNEDALRHALVGHVKLAAVSTVGVIAIAVPLGILVTRPFARFLTPPVLAVANIGQAVPSIGLLVLFALTIGIGFRPTVYALIAYSALPVLRNTMVGLQQVDRSVIDAGRGMGLTKLGALVRIELPLAVPVILAGVRTALILNVGVATLGTFVNAPSLGDFIVNGLALDRDPVLYTGAILTGLLALTIDWMASVTEDVLRPRGL